jgi:hypothetical protein
MGVIAMDREEALELLKGGLVRILEWNRRRRAGEAIPDLREADLSEADLSGANLSEADLRGADLRGTDLHGVVLTRADLTGAQLHGAYLLGCAITQDQLDSANGDAITTLSSRLVRPSSWSRTAISEHADKNPQE